MDTMDAQDIVKLSAVPLAGARLGATGLRNVSTGYLDDEFEKFDVDDKDDARPVAVMMATLANPVSGDAPKKIVAYEDDFEAYDEQDDKPPVPVPLLAKVPASASKRKPVRVSDYADEFEDFSDEEPVVVSREPVLVRCPDTDSCSKPMVAKPSVSSPERPSVTGNVAAEAFFEADPHATRKAAKETPVPSLEPANATAPIPFLPVEPAQPLMPRQEPAKPANPRAWIYQRVALTTANDQFLLDLPPQVQPLGAAARNTRNATRKPQFATVATETDLVEAQDDAAAAHEQQRLVQTVADAVRGGRALTQPSLLAPREAQRLARALRRCCPLVENALGAAHSANYSAAPARRSRSRNDGVANRFFLPFSDAVRVVDLADWTVGRQIVDVFIPRGSRAVNLVVLAWSHRLRPPSAGENETSACGLVTVLRVDSDTPTVASVLLCAEARLVCVAADASGEFVVAGTESGGLVVWHLGNEKLRLLLHDQASAVSARLPTFGSYKNSWQENAHAAPVRSIAITGGLRDSVGENLDELGVSGGGIRIVSMDDDGVVCRWMVTYGATMLDAEKKADERLAHLARVRVTPTSRLALASQLHLADSAALGLRTAEVFPHLRYRALYLVASDGGGLSVHDDSGSRELLPPPGLDFVVPQFVLPRNGATRVTAVAFSPFVASLFLAGLDSGEVALYSLTCPDPLAVWTAVDSGGGSSVTAVVWSPQRPAVFFVLDAASVLYGWDLALSSDRPQLSQSLRNYRTQSASEALGSAVALSVTAAPALAPGPLAAVDCGHLPDPSECRDISERHRSARLLLGFSSGLVELHQMSEQWLCYQDNEEAVLKQLLV